MASQVPRISVLMAAHNAGAYIHAAVQSILRQSFRNFEFVIIDDGSTDDTAEALQHFKQQDSRIKLRHQDQAGLTRSLNCGLTLSNTELIARMDADDISHPDRLAKQLEFMDAHPEVSVLGCRYRTVSNSGKTLGYSPKTLARKHEAMWRLPLGSTLPHPGVMFRKQIIDSVGGYDERWQHAEDYELWSRLVRAGYQIANLPDCLLDYRSHPMQVSSIRSKQQMAFSLEISKQHFSWAIGEDVSRQAVTDIRQLCNYGHLAGEMDPQRTDAIVGLSSEYVLTIGKRFHRHTQRRARNYFMRKFVKAGLMAATRLDSNANLYMKAAARLLA